MAAETRRGLIVTLIVSTLAEMIVFALLLFVPAGTLGWWRAWVYLGAVLVGTIGSSLNILDANPELLAERMKPPIQQGQSRADKVLLPAMVAAFAAVLALAPLDVFRLHLLPKANPVASALGLAAFIAGWWLAHRAMRENAFATPVVKDQRARGKTVVQSGPYRIVRHPMYAGGVLVFVGTPLWLESWAAAILALAAVGLIVLRIIAEERFLRCKLSGYAAYTKRVRYRLIPSIW
ncbi:isoprenylcysteine carboxyl methyltransferase [Vulcanimicrobium alpinum]|uniref:Isoprenylcysteine carboxyl methyltransferase n=1 Tax=Vulcanimicrobium alpinum TaxID=3016050 RepID=A0AAN2C962_UNVUL|nr:isoprenylcysteine carboxylmethyltransferase family protein [Vulcanimicrobium alpinum]BDE05696.1 isoprenylcysteine carboxyl methyltransferase [Vulcanimicrobium alpinum]